MTKNDKDGNRSMEKPVLVIMAAGMGSRYGGLKQIDPVENEQDFRSCIGDVVKGHIEVEYAFQELSDIPAGQSIPEGRVKPWGTAHAVLSARKLIDGPFAVINADDFYGREAFGVIYDYLANNNDDDKYRYAMVGYELRNTLTENGYVSRGICSVDSDGYLKDIVERTHIEKRGEGAVYTEDDGLSYLDIPADSIVSMNMWGFSGSFMDEAARNFEVFFRDTVPRNQLKAECYLPGVVDGLLKADKATVKVLRSKDKWFGVTYKEDKPFVMQSIKALKDKGEYPDRLW